EALDAFLYLSRTEGIIPALESAHAVAHARRLAPELGRGKLLVINLSGRGDKDAPQVRELLAQASRSEPKASEVHRNGSRSEPKASEVHRDGSRSEPKAGVAQRAGRTNA